MKLIKKIAAAVTAMAMTAGLMSIVASASNPAMYQIGSTHAYIINKTYTNRYMEAHINVYSENTGALVHSYGASGTGNYNKKVQVNNNSYSSNGYDFYDWVELYNSSSSLSGVYFFKDGHIY